mgnify:CR=1 FL=1
MARSLARRPRRSGKSYSRTWVILTDGKLRNASQLTEKQRQMIKWHCQEGDKEWTKGEPRQ